jgi:hypothetical protein
MRARELVAIALCYGTGPKEKRLALQQAGLVDDDKVFLATSQFPLAVSEYG